MGRTEGMRWDCARDGCFNQKHRLKLNVFSTAFPARIGFSDVDGIVEINGEFLMLEWKSSSGPIPQGQDIMYRRISKDKEIPVLVVRGDAEAMTATAMMLYWHGKPTGWKACTTEDVLARVKAWAEYARGKSTRLQRAPIRPKRSTG